MQTPYTHIHFDEIDSTSAYLLREYSNLKNYTIVSASYQTNGKGRQDRKWISSKGTNLLFSLLLKENNLVNAFPYISLCSAYVIAKALIKLKIKNVSIKWPNDVFIGGKKICGILLQGSLPNYLVVGIGLNVNQVTDKNELNRSVTSLKAESSKTYNLNELEDLIYLSLITEIKKIFAKDYSFLKIVKKLDYLKGKTVEAEINNKVEQIQVLGINDDCTLKIDLDGKELSLSTGEINLHLN